MRLEKPTYFNNRFLKKNQVRFRRYQENIVNRCFNKNSLVVLPTGLGKTIIGILLIAKVMEKYPKGKILILAPTRPLVAQHADSCLKFLNISEEKQVLFTGKIPPEKRVLSFQTSQIIVSTPQVIKNDVERGRYDLKHVSMIIFDESHKTKGNYAYNFISDEYMHSCSDPLVLGLTASPGKNYERIQTLCENLFIENVIFKTYLDEDVREYVFEIDTILEYVNLPSKVLEISAVWYNLFEKYLRFFLQKKLIPPNKPYYSKLDFLGISRDLSISLNYENGNSLDITEEDYIDLLYYKDPKIIDLVKKNDYDIHSIYSYCSSCISILHGKDLLETQDISLFKSFLNRILSKAEIDIISAKRIVNSDHYNYINDTFREISLENLTHPKIDKLFSTIKDEIEIYNNDKILIFTQYREMAEFLTKIIRHAYSTNLKIEKFIGQTSKFEDQGFSQQKQIEILKQFREGEINILIATSVAEEGLDIPNVDAIIFYEPVPSEIRLIQRRGRTGRYAPGRCFVLITENTVDVPFHHVAERKFNQMHEILSYPQQLNLCEGLNRTRISFTSSLDRISELDFLKNFEERKKREKEMLANRSIEQIISELDKFSGSNDFVSFKNHGVTFLSDLVELSEDKLKTSILRLKGKKTSEKLKKKSYLNRNVKTLINLVKIHSTNGKISLSSFQKLAEEEEIEGDKFRIHFNHACYLGHLKKKNDFIEFVSDYE